MAKATATKDLTRFRKLFSPRSLALIGATPDESKAPAGRLLDYLTRYEYGGAIYLVNPKYSEIGERRCYASVRELPEVPDVGLVCVPAGGVPDVLVPLLDIGTGSAIIYAGGYSETGTAGRRLEARLKSIIDRYDDVAVLGPNCQGLANFRDRFVSNFSGGISVGRGDPGPIAIVSQSGALAGRIFRSGIDEGLSFSYVVSTGNEVDVDLGDCIEYVCTDPSVEIIACYMEGTSRGPKLRRALEDATASDRRVVVLKSGRSEGSRRAIQSHTNSLAGSEEVFSAVFERAGCFRADSVAEMLTVLNAYVRSSSEIRTKRAVPKVLVLSPSGGGGALLADACSRMGLDVPRLPKAARQEIESLLPGYASADNPIDFSNAWVAEPERLTTLVSIGAACPDLDAILLFLGQGTAGSPPLHRRAKAAVKAAAGLCAGKPLVVGWPVDVGGDLAELRAAGVAVFSTEAECVLALRALVREQRARPSTSPRRNGTQWREWFAGRTADAALSHGDTMELLSAHGIPAVPGSMTTSAPDAVRSAGRLGYPVVLKAEFDRLVHRTDVGGVRAGLDSPRGLRAAYEELWSGCSGLQGFVGLSVHEMVRGVEVFVGFKRDENFEAVVVVAPGGKLVELIGDKVLLLPPFSSRDVLRAIQGTRLHTLLAGYRGDDAANIRALCDLVTRVGRLAANVSPYVQAIDLNPVIVDAATARIVDAKVELRAPGRG